MIEIHPERLTIEEAYELAKEHISVEVDSFRGCDYHHKVMTVPMFVITKNPRDYPGKHVVRLFDGNKPTCFIVVKRTYTEAKKSIPRCCSHCFRRTKTDDPVIVETWM